MKNEYKEHWDKVYATKSPKEVSWTQDEPNSSLQLIKSCQLAKSAEIIDVGGGDSLLVDFLLKAGYEHITVLDVSANAIARAKERLGEKASRVTWIVKDIRDFKPTKKYDLWHDRAVFHFLTIKEDIETYKDLVKAHVSGSLIVATFSTNGPVRCSGLDTLQYSTQRMTEIFKADFTLVESFYEDHLTPFDTQQNFLFTHFTRS